MDVLMEFIYNACIGLFFSFMLMLIYVAIWEDDDDE